ncbi:MAG: hypothetical protein K2P81_17225 [Bacteriovoracaceae bacterium]|nr:hypothetical protein [Bacteriovoracaceae bacterium]
MKFFLPILLSISFAWAQDGSLNKNCSKSGYACGECDTAIQSDFNNLIADITGSSTTDDGHWGGDMAGKKKKIKPGVTLEGTLSKIKDLMKKGNPAGGNGLNMIVIGESESLQPSDVKNGKMYPRVAIKSPNSELWVTFSTDPSNAAYQTLEVMRWNGKAAKYEFMELDFNPNHRQMDGTGEKCLSCHKEPNPRPNWDTYRAWAGVVPSRDDMLEMKAEGGRTLQGPKAGMGADGRAYLSFLEQVVDAKEKKPNDRLALMDLPVDDQVQFRDREPKVSTLSPRAQFNAIKGQVETTGHYRIPHYPYKSQMKSANFDVKTADYTGPSQAAFDQMSGQNFCRISNDLKKNPNYDKFKYYIAGVAQGCFQFPGDAKAWIPESRQQNIASWYKANPTVRLRNLSLAKRTPNLNGFDATASAIVEDTKQNHSMADEFKMARHERFLDKYMTSVEGRSNTDVQDEASYFARQMQAPRLGGFHAIDDAGGVKGVAEAHPKEISAIRAVLEPMGIDVTQWSMMRGNDPNYNSLAFSDQFALFFEQSAVTDVVKNLKKDPKFNGDTCQTLQNLSYQSLADTTPIEVGPLANKFDVESWCRDRMVSDPGINDNMKSLFEVNREMLADESKDLFLRCADCHGSGEIFPFPGLDRLTDNSWNDEAWAEFNGFIRGDGAIQTSAMGPMILSKLSLGKMPPGGWRVGSDAAARKKEDDRRRSMLADYVRLSMVTSKNQEAIAQFCTSITNSTQPKSLTKPAETTETSQGSQQ